jgi:5-methylcytosine-specific restriction endonuclease McrA
MINKKEYNKQWRDKNKEHIKKYNKKWWEENPDYRNEYYERNKKKVKEQNKNWRKGHPEYDIIYLGKYREENKERLSIQHKKWRENNPEHHKKWQENNLDKLQEIIKKYNKTEKGKANAQRVQSKRRANEREIINTLTYQEWLDILKGYKYECAYCNKKFDLFNKPERDHVIPISKGGNNIKENIVPACKSCNSSKQSKDLIIFNKNKGR